MPDLVAETGTGSSSANSYATIDEGDIYHEAHLYATDWTGASDDDKEKALIWASRLLDEQVNWSGGRYSQNQGLRWPRIGVYDADGWVIDSDEIPQAVKDAACEYGRLLIASNLTATEDTVGFRKLKVDVIEIEMDKYDRKPTMPLSVWNIVKHLGTKAGKRKRMLVLG